MFDLYASMSKYVCWGNSEAQLVEHMKTTSCTTGQNGKGDKGQWQLCMCESFYQGYAICSSNGTSAEVHPRKERMGSLAAVHVQIILRSIYNLFFQRKSCKVILRRAKTICSANGNAADGEIRDSRALCMWCNSTQA